MQVAAAPLPRKTREIQNVIIDSTRWNGFKFRNDDIVISTYGKSGTTWTQQIVGELIFRGTASAVFASGSLRGWMLDSFLSNRSWRGSQYSSIAGS